MYGNKHQNCCELISRTFSFQALCVLLTKLDGRIRISRHLPTHKKPSRPQQPPLRSGSASNIAFPIETVLQPPHAFVVVALWSGLDGDDSVSEIRKNTCADGCVCGVLALPSIAMNHGGRLIPLPLSTPQSLLHKITAKAADDDDDGGFYWLETPWLALIHSSLRADDYCTVRRGHDRLENVNFCVRERRSRNDKVEKVVSLTCIHSLHRIRLSDLDLHLLPEVPKGCWHPSALD